MPAAERHGHKRAIPATIARPEGCMGQHYSGIDGWAATWSLGWSILFFCSGLPKVAEATCGTEFSFPIADIALVIHGVSSTTRNPLQWAEAGHLICSSLSDAGRRI